MAGKWSWGSRWQADLPLAVELGREISISVVNNCRSDELAKRINSGTVTTVTDHRAALLHVESTITMDTDRR